MADEKKIVPPPPGTPAPPQPEPDRVLDFDPFSSPELKPDYTVEQSVDDADV